MGKRKFTTYAAKMRQANREALATVAALVIIAVTWLSWGIGLADSDIELFSTPIWIIGGCVGTWLMAVLAALVLGCGVFANFSLDDDAPEDGPAAAPASERAAAGVAASAVTESARIEDGEEVRRG